MISLIQPEHAKFVSSKLAYLMYITHAMFFSMMKLQCVSSCMQSTIDINGFFFCSHVLSLFAVFFTCMYNVFFLRCCL